MDEKEEVEKAVKRGSRAGSRRKRYTYDEKLRAVKLHVEEGFNGELVPTGDDRGTPNRRRAWRPKGCRACGPSDPRPRPDSRCHGAGFACIKGRAMCRGR